MGLERRKKSGRDFGGTKLNVPGEGIFTVKRTPNDKTHIHKQIGRIPRPSQTPTPTPSVTPTITPSVTPSVTPTPSLPCVIPSGLTQTLALFETNNNFFTTGITSTCESLYQILVSGFTTGNSYSISTVNSPIQVGDRIYLDVSGNATCQTIPDGYYIIDYTTLSPYSIEVSGGTVINLPTCEIDPISLGQPYLYYQSFDLSYFTPPNPSTGVGITEIYRYNDSLFSGLTLSTGCTPTLETINGQEMLYFPGFFSCDSPFYDTNQSLDFMLTTGYSYTIYFVGKPLSGTSITCPVFGNRNSPSAIDNDLRFGVVNSKDFTLLIRNTGFVGTTVLDLPIEINIDSQSLMNKDVRVISVRAQDPSNTTDIAAYGYVNGLMTSSIPQTNLVSPSISNKPVKIGGTESLGPGSLRYQGYLGEIIVFTTFHDESTHYWVTQFLKNRWNIL